MPQPQTTTTHLAKKMVFVFHRFSVPVRLLSQHQCLVCWWLCTRIFSIVVKPFSQFSTRLLTCCVGSAGRRRILGSALLRELCRRGARLTFCRARTSWNRQDGGN